MSAGILSPKQVKAHVRRPDGDSAELYTRSRGEFDGDLIGESAVDLPLGENY